MKIEVTLRQEYSKVVRVFRGWHTAQTWIEETLLADGPDVEVTVRELKEDAEVLLAELPFHDTDFQD